MNIGGIDFPREVLEAQRNGNLVVFAGAGVSNGSPSNLPLFNELATLIGYGDSPILDGESLDVYLGRLADGGNGLRVHEAAVKILSRSDSKPTDLHRSLLRLFLKGQAIRLVTTNFDNHFVDVACDLGTTPRIFIGPALPLGGDFDGIVHLHGSLQGKAKDLILTDVDFGTAYLTEAWASRFLYQMFLRYTVLFVGYSHGDVVMNYVAKGISMNRSQPKYILTEDRKTVWRSLGISPVHFEKNQGHMPYSVLSDAVGRWADEIQRGLHEKAERIRTIVEGAPPVDNEDADYLRESLLFAETARHFTKFAKMAEYVTWVAENGFFKPLFQNDRRLSEAEQEIAFWYVNHCIPNYHEEALIIFQKGSNVLNGWVGSLLYHLLRNREKFASADRFSTWTKILLNQSNVLLGFHHWEELLESCLWPQDESLMILLLDRCFQPQFLTRNSWSFPSDSEELDREEMVEGYVNLSEDHSHFVGRIWEAHFKPNLSSIAFRLFPLLVANLEKTHLLLHREIQGRTFDSLSFSRRKIRGSGYTSSGEVIEVLIDATRDVLEQLISDYPSEVSGLISICFRSPSLLLKRIAVYGVEVNNKLSPNEKIEWLLANSLIFNHEVRTEVFSILRASFPLADEKMQKKLIDYVMVLFSSVTEDDDANKIGPYSVYNLLYC